MFTPFSAITICRGEYECLHHLALLLFALFKGPFVLLVIALVSEKIKLYTPMPKSCYSIRYSGIVKIHQNFKQYRYIKGKVSRDFDWLQMILINITWVPGVPLDV